MLIVLIALIINIALSCLAGNIASNKGYSFWGFFLLSFCLSAIIGIIVALCVR